MKIAFIHAEKASYPVRLLCRVLGVSSSGYDANACAKDWLRGTVPPTITACE